MSTPMRLSDKLVHEAEAEGQAFMRSAPKQIEYWAWLGKTVSGSVSSDDLLALAQGLADVKIELSPSALLDPGEVLVQVNKDRIAGHLSKIIKQTGTVYGASRNHPGMLERTLPDGTCELGHFRDGKFISSR